MPGQGIGVKKDVVDALKYGGTRGFGDL